MQRPIHLSFGQVNIVVDRYKYGWTGKNERPKKVFQNNIYYQLCLRIEYK